MKKYNLLMRLGLGFFLFALATVALAQQASRPNIILIVADDLGYGDVGFNGQRLIRTPNIDGLATEGMRFDQFYAGTAVCAPSRSALMTGQHTGHTFIRGNLGVAPEGQYPLADSVRTIAEVLRDAGYRTGAFGKWGLGPVLSEGDPNRQGFDDFFGYNCQSLAHRYYPTHLWSNSKKVPLSANGELEHNKVYAPDVIQAQALSFLEDNKDRPFFLFLPHILPHAELLVPDDSIFRSYKGKFEEKAYRGEDYGRGTRPAGYASQAYTHATFASMVTRLDMYVGQVVEKLKSLGIDDNTIIVFSSDNGPHQEGGADPDFFNSGGGLRGYKRDLYEGGIRVPFVVRWPQAIKANSVSQHIAAFWDILPTFAQLAQAAPTGGIDGLSFANTLLGKGQQPEHPYLYWEFHEQGGKQAVRYGKWKAVRLQAASKDKRTLALYDLETDPQERNDIAKKQPALVRQLEGYMAEAHRESTVFPFLTQ